MFSINREEVPKFPISLHNQGLDNETTQLLDEWIGRVRPFLNEVEDNPSRVSAEFSTVNALKKQRKLVEKPVFILFFTNTAGGYAAEKILRKIFEETFNASVKVFFVDVHVGNQQTLNQDISEYMKKLAESLEAGEPTTTCFAPIGGYKVMTSFGYIVGSFLGYPTAYLHEDHQVLHEIPPVPIQIDQDIIQQFTPLLRRCQSDYIELHSLSFQEQSFINKFKSLFSIEEEMVCLNPFGIFMLERTRYSHLLQTHYYGSKQVRALINKSKHQSLFIKQQLRELVKKIKSGDGRLSDLQHEKEIAGLDSRLIHFHLYKGASNGQTAFRLTYRYDENEDILYANYIWLDHDCYEREITQGKGIYKQVSEFSRLIEYFK
ncbi:putative CRISPR-associated protein [Bacillus sp. FJAT-47783]|uniref:putative CRISPR-associated protein n=1 Tax=Bacillus sp. FJAT-47783 TaxID=2922712 RepID=UPI001FABAD78|nr:putative CRISPR-associated protein [Bacillus sp. FJAT-47783]